MHIVKWTRKNMQKIMVFVIIFSMISFVIGSVGLEWVVGLFGGGDQLIGTYHNEQKIKSPDFIRAQNELAVLRMLMADRFLMAQSGGGLSGPLLMYLLFPESPFSGQIAAQMKQAVQQGQLPISLDELNDFFQQQPERPEILWLLLKEEAQKAGCIISNDEAAQTLRYLVPQITNNQIDAAELVNEIITRSNVSEEHVLEMFSDMMSILAYADNVMNCQAVTINQIKASLGRSKESIDVEYVKIEAEPLIDKNADISDAQIQEQFDAYKATFPNIPTDDNPYGFGYKLPKRVQLEYMVVLIDDITKRVERPSHEAMEEYYSNNLTNFQTMEPSDPDDPESEKVTKTRSFAEVAPEIRQTLEAAKAQTEANILFNEIKDKTESGFENLNFDDASVAELQKAAGDFVSVSNELSEKYNIPIVSGKTGWLDAATLGQDKILANMGFRRGQNFLRLSDLAFAAAEEKQQSQRIGIPSVRVWENLGPLNGGYYSPDESRYYRLMALVRVIGIKEAAAPDNINIEFDTHGIVINEKTAEEDTSFSVIEKVKDDIRLLKAMDAAQSRANEFIALTKDGNWSEAVKDYNEKYAKDTDDDTETIDNQEIEMRGFKRRLRASHAEIEMTKKIMRENPASAPYFQQRIFNNLLTNRFYTLLPEDAETTGVIQDALKFEPERAYYVVKEVVRQPATIADYLENKAQTALQLNAVESAGLALIHFSPKNILVRLDYQPKWQQEPSVDQEEATPAENE